MYGVVFKKFDVFVLFEVTEDMQSFKLYSDEQHANARRDLLKEQHPAFEWYVVPFGVVNAP